MTDVSSDHHHDDSSSDDEEEVAMKEPFEVMDEDDSLLDELDARQLGDGDSTGSESEQEGEQHGDMTMELRRMMKVWRTLGSMSLITTFKIPIGQRVERIFMERRWTVKRPSKLSRNMYHLI